MADTQQDAHAKALAINLEATIYGTIAEIGAGQEVARWFLQAGAASGTVAKTVSAYDMTFSDAIYGKVGRYVSRDRLEGMLEHEYALLLERLAAAKGAQTRFFTFADTISARNFAGTNECHGWVGLRFQTASGGAPNDVIIHVNLLDPTNLLQQQAVGILGVNLIFAAFYQREPLGGFATAVFEELARRVEIDVVAFRGPAFADVDDAAATLALVQNGLADAVVFPVGADPVPPSELLRKRPLVLTPGVFARHEPVHAAMLAAGCAHLASEISREERQPLPLYVVTGGRREDARTPSTDLLRRVEALRGTGSDVLVAGAVEMYRVVRYALRYTTAPIRLVIGAPALADVMQTHHYRDLDGELMEALAQLFACNVRMYVYPVPKSTLEPLDASAAAWIAAPDDDGMLTLDHLVVPSPTSHLFAYLVASGFLRPIPAL